MLQAIETLEPIAAARTSAALDFADRLRMLKNDVRLTRRAVTTGLAAAVTAMPALGLAVVARSDPLERIKHHTASLAQAMRDYYGVEVEVITYPKTDDMKPLVFVVAHVQTR